MRIKCLKVNDLTEAVCENNFKVKYLLLNETAEFLNRKNKVIHEQDVITTSKHRTKVICPIFYECGGCDFLHVTYQEQLRLKTEYVYKRFEKSKLKFNMLPIIGSDNSLYYRHKVVLSATTSKKKLRLGLYQQRSKKVIPFLNCYIQDKSINKVMRSVEQLLVKYKIPAYDIDRNSGIIKHILIRKAFTSKKMLLVFVTQTKLFPNAKKIVAHLIRLHPEIETITQNIHNKKTHLVLLDNEKNLLGKGYIEDSVNNIKFRLSAKSFYQINPVQMIKLYSEALQLASIEKTDLVIDAYSGIGTISLLAAQSAKQVIAIESNSVAHKDALFNKKNNGITNIEFINQDVDGFINTFTGDVDCLIMDPTRAGTTNSFLQSVIKLRPNKIIYISCNPETQVRDILLLKKHYKINAVLPVDMFSQTRHVETIVALSKI